MIRSLLNTVERFFPAETAAAHCDGPCGVYDPASIRVAAEAVLSMTKKIIALTPPDPKDAAAMAAYNNTLSRYIAIKEEQSELAKREILILWTDFFKPTHLDTFPDLHDTFWKAAKACSSCKQEVSAQHADELMDAVKNIHEMFWKAKGRDVEYTLANP